MKAEDVMILVGILAFIIPLSNIIFNRQITAFILAINVFLVGVFWFFFQSNNR